MRLALVAVLALNFAAIPHGVAQAPNAYLLGLAGLLVGMYLWGHFGPPATDPDDTDAYFFGLLVGGLLVCGVVASLWKFWPRTAKTS